MKKIFISIIALLAFVVSVNAEVKTDGTVLIQLKKNSAPGDKDNLAGSFVRSEVKVSGKKDNGLSGLIHVRFQQSMAGGRVGITARQFYFKLPIAKVVLKAGRWYEAYTPGAYFGRYLFGVSGVSNGGFCQTYDLVDGITANIPVVSSTSLNLAFLPEDSKWNSCRTVARITSNPIKALKLGIGANIEAIVPNKDVDRVNMAMVTASYSIIKDLNLFTEVGMVDLSDVSDNLWILGGADLPTGGILNQLRAEIEYKKDRLATSDCDLAWMLVMVKKAAGLKFNLNIGADPKSLASQEIGDVGAHFRVTAGL